MAGKAHIWRGDGTDAAEQPQVIKNSDHTYCRNGKSAR